MPLASCHGNAKFAQTDLLINFSVASVVGISPPMKSQLLDGWLSFFDSEGCTKCSAVIAWCQEPVELQNRLGGGLFGQVFRSRRILAAHIWTQFCDDACQASPHVWAYVDLSFCLFFAWPFACDYQLSTSAFLILLPPACGTASSSSSARCVAACLVKAHSVVFCFFPLEAQDTGVKWQ